jgi:hypothetical protein
MRILLTLLLAGSAMAQIQREPVTLDELPAPVRQAIEREVQDHEILSLAREVYPEGAVGYAVKWKTLTTGHVEAMVASDGSLVGRWLWVDQPSGSGP